MKIYPHVHGVVEFFDPVRGFALVKSTTPAVGPVLVLSRMMRDFGSPFLPGMTCELGDVHSGRQGRLVASWIIDAVQPDKRLRDWLPVEGKFFAPQLGYGFVTSDEFGDIYVPHEPFRKLGCAPDDFKLMSLDAILFKHTRGVFVHLLRKPWAKVA